MFHSQLRKAIAQTFPDRYNVFTWRKLLPEYVEEQLEAYLTLSDRYEKGQILEKPVISSELRQAATLLARQQNYSYDFLALSYHLLQWEVAAEMKQKEFYRHLSEGYERWGMDYKQLADKVIDSLSHNENVNNRTN